METDSILIVVGCVVGGALLFGGLICFGLVSAVNTMSGRQFRLYPADEERHKRKFRAAAEHNEWAKENGFKWVGAYIIREPQQIFIAAWKHTDAPRFFCVYSHAANDYYDFVTEYEDDKSLTTSGTKDAHTLPFAAGKYVQSFHDAEHEDLWEEHQDAEEFLESQAGLQRARELPAFPKLVAGAIRKQMQHVKSIPLWQVRGIFWYLFRGAKSNRRIEEQGVA